MKPENTRNFQKETTFKKFQASWSNSHEFAQSKDSIEELIEHLKSLEKDSVFQNEVVILATLAEIEPIYVTSNIEKMLGYTADEFIKMGAFGLHKITAEEHINFWPDLSKCDDLTNKYIRSKNMIPDVGEGYMVGPKIVAKNPVSYTHLTLPTTPYV